MGLVCRGGAGVACRGGGSRDLSCFWSGRGRGFHGSGVTQKTPGGVTQRFRGFHRRPRGKRAYVFRGRSMASRTALSQGRGAHWRGLVLHSRAIDHDVSRRRRRLRRLFVAPETFFVRPTLCAAGAPRFKGVFSLHATTSPTWIQSSDTTICSDSAYPLFDRRSDSGRGPSDRRSGFFTQCIPPFPPLRAQWSAASLPHDPATSPTRRGGSPPAECSPR